MTMIDYLRNNLDSPEGKITANIKQIERLLNAAENIIRDST